MLARKKIAGLWLLFFLFINIPQVVAANEVDWQITWKDNNTLNEKVTFHDPGLAKHLDGWQYSKVTNAVILEREVKDWSAYEQLPDKLPLHVSIKDYVLIKIITFNTVPSQVEADTVIDKVTKLNGVNLEISVPGLIRGGSADEVKGLTAVWHLDRINELGSQGPMLRVATFDGLVLGMVIAFFGLLIIMLVFWNKVRKTHKLIEQEYSLTNLHLPNEDDKNI
ncbi:MAG: hypothetical protein ABFC94_10765 [Syntrophomonas sp.]